MWIEVLVLDTLRYQYSKRAVQKREMLFFVLIAGLIFDSFPAQMCLLRLLQAFFHVLYQLLMRFLLSLQCVSLLVSFRLSILVPKIPRPTTPIMP